MPTTRALVEVEALTDLFPHRVARAAELAGLGLTGGAIQSCCRPGGPWQRLAPGVILLSNAPPSRSQLIACAVRYAGPGAVVTGWDALIRHGISPPAALGQVHVLIPHCRQVRSTGHMHIERTTRLPDPVLCKGFPIAPLARAAMDTARRLESTDSVRALIGEVVQRGRVRPAELRAELDAGSIRGTALPRLVLDEVTSGIRSMAEARARRLVARSGLPQPRWHCPIRAPDGDLLGIVDAWWDDVGLAWDVDSFQFHPPPDTFREAVRRRSRLTAAGIIVVHTTPDRLRAEPPLVLDELRSAHRHATIRPRPPVISNLAGAS